MPSFREIMWLKFGESVATEKKPTQVAFCANIHPTEFHTSTHQSLKD